jgi:putative inorganic carbon (HCO3(-)) transporter
VSSRDLALFVLLAVLVVATLRRPVYGVLGWVLFALLNPHRHAWGAAIFFPFSQVIAIATLAAVLMTKEHRQIKGGLPAFVLLLILLWSMLNAPLGFNPPRAWEYVDRVFKAYLFVWLALLLMHTRQHVMWLLATFVVSLGFYGVKGGLFTVMTGGNFRVSGPAGSMIAGNNELAVAVIITIPVLYFFYQQQTRPLYRRAVLAAIGLCAMSAIGSYSRGALLAIVGMSAVLWLRSQHKAVMGVGLVALLFVAIPFMPEHWTERMNTIKTHEEDASASYRLIAWETAYNLAKDRFPLGGGFEYETREVSGRYSPDPNLVMVPHSVYFQTMGGLGFIGLGLWLAFWILVWRQCAWLRKRCRTPGTLWAGQLGSMVQVSLAGYAIGGAFLNLAFWDGVYYLYAAIGVTVYVARRQLAEEATGANPAPANVAAGTRAQGVPAAQSR